MAFLRRNLWVFFKEHRYAAHLTAVYLHSPIYIFPLTLCMGSLSSESKGQNQGNPEIGCKLRGYYLFRCSHMKMVC